VVDFVPNFDSSSVEPLILPALLPVILINGHFGIATGATAKVPSCQYKSVLKLLKLVYEGEEITPKLMNRVLEFRTVFGGSERPTDDKEAKSRRLDAFRTLKGKINFYSNTKYDEKKQTVTITKFAFTKMETVLERLMVLPGVAQARDDSTKHDKYGVLTVVLKKSLTTKEYTKLVKRIDAEVSSTLTTNLNFTERYVDKEGQGQAAMKPMPMAVMLQEWVKWRTELERKACQYWIDQADKEIRRLELMMIAVDNRKLIIESLDKDCTEEELEQWLAKKLKITQEEAAVIYRLQVRQLRRLERKSLEEQVKAVMAKRKELETRKKKPESYMAQQLENFTKLVEVD
jgi:DNA gyrase/topoisomerase IV subunit A